MTILNTNSQQELNLKLFYKEAVAYADGKVREQGKKMLRMCVTKELLFKEYIDNFNSNAKHRLTDASNR
jgi:hypothetical protein